MPFRAVYDGEIVAPASVPGQEPVACPECGGTMYTRKRKGEARHFYHANSSADSHCSIAGSGESDIHARYVALAAEALTDRFDSQAIRCSIEERIELKESYLGHDHRRADVLLKFESENPYFGHGLIVEVQHKNHQKNTTAATYDYLTAGYSIVWLSSDDFGPESLEYPVIEQAFRSDGGDGYTVRERSPRHLLDCQQYLYNGEHCWREIPEAALKDGVEEYEICVDHVCDVRRRYNDETDSYEYGVAPGLPSYFQPKLLRKAIVKESVLDLEERLSQRFPVATMEKALAANSEIEYCRGPKGFHEWKAPETIWSSFDGQPRVELRECRYCPVHLLTDFRGRESQWTYIFFGDRPDPSLNLEALEKNPYRWSHRSHDPERWYERCPECGDTDPQ